MCIRDRKKKASLVTGVADLQKQTTSLTADMTTVKKTEDDLKNTTSSLEGKMGKCSSYFTVK